MAKRILGVPISKANVCAQTELGLKPLRMLLYLHQLNFYTRVMNLPQSRWVRRVLVEHLEGGWDSPYILNILKIRQKLGLLFAAPTVPFLKLHLDTWFLNRTNMELSRLNLPCVERLHKFSRQSYVFENDGCSPIACFKFLNAGLGNRAPRIGRRRTGVCSLCSGVLSEVHVVFDCAFMDAYRSGHTDISVFMTMCRSQGIFSQVAFKMYVTGLDWRGNLVSTSLLLRRGVHLKNILKEWLQRT